jgi:hypothetical protein
MRKWRLHISTLLLLIFASTLLSVVLLPSDREENCSEFAHIHRIHFHSASQNSYNSHKSRNGHSSDDECHSGQSIAGVFLFPSVPTLSSFRLPAIQKKPVAVIESHHPSPSIEPLRKPPKPGSQTLQASSV